MWTRKELKKNALSRFRANYWLCVLAALILAALLGNFKAENRYSEEDIGNPKSYPQMVIEENGLNTNAVTEAEAVREQFEEIAESAAEEFGSKETAVGVMLGAIAVVLTIIIVFVIGRIAVHSGDTHALYAESNKQLQKHQSRIKTQLNCNEIYSFL